jgi:phosphatidylglycerol:prolipoprotein diacylglycerol transferase
MSLFPSRQIFLEIGPLAIHWYGLMYLLAFLAAWWLIPRLEAYRNLSLSKDQRSSLLTYAILGTLVGGRLGYVLFYGATYYGTHPLEIFAVWNGGMSFHGGLLGVGTAIFLFSRKEHVPLWNLLDIAVVPAALGLAFGRFGNFINQELYGPVTSLPWGISIPGVEGLRHPTPLYAMVKDLLIAGLCFFHLRSTNYQLLLEPEPRSRGPTTNYGTTTALFLILYGALRFLIEFVRVETATGVDLGALHLTRGQLLTIPVFFLGLCLLFRRRLR